MSNDSKPENTQGPDESNINNATSTNRRGGIFVVAKLNDDNSNIQDSVLKSSRRIE